MAARVLVGVVADDRGVRDGAVDAAVDAREARGHLVDRPVQVVDAPLERDGEVDEILAAAAEQHPLRVADALDLDPRPPGEAEADRADGDAGDARRRVRRFAVTCTRGEPNPARR